MKSVIAKRAVLIAFFLTIACVVLHGQIGPGDPGDGSDPDLPISGIEILIALGGLLGVSRFFKTGKKKNH